MTGMNKAYFMGRLGRTPELRTSSTGKLVASVTIGTPHVTRVDGQTIEGIEWHRLTAYGDHATHLASRQKGDSLAVECEIRPMKWTDKDDRTHHEVAFVITSVLWCTTPTTTPKRPEVV